MMLIGAHIYHPSAALSVRGPDANSFLQGQFTNDLKRPIGAVTYGLWLNQKGKVVADSHVLRLAEAEFLVLSQHSAAAVIRQRLEDYLIADDVTVTDETVAWRVIAVVGARAKEIVTQVCGGAPEHDTFRVSDDGGRIFWGRYSVGENFSIILPAERADGVFSRLLAAGCIALDPGAAEAERIVSDIPIVPLDIGPTDLPNEGVLEAAAISYTKGCYLGQEVMARLKSMGQVRRRLLRVKGESGIWPTPPAVVFSGSRQVGELRSAVSDGAGGWLGLALLSLMHLTPEAALAFAADAPAALRLADTP